VDSSRDRIRMLARRNAIRRGFRGGVRSVVETETVGCSLRSLRSKDEGILVVHFRYPYCVCVIIFFSLFHFCVEVGYGMDGWMGAVWYGRGYGIP
jgi:hypothetical protein